MKSRTLSLKRETLSELTSRELGSVVGGTHVACDLTTGCTHVSLDVECPTDPVYACVRTLEPTCIQTQTR